MAEKRLDERIEEREALLAQSGEVGADGAEVVGALWGAKATGDFLFELGHSNCALGEVMPTPGLCRVPWRAGITTNGREDRVRVNQFVGIIKGSQGRRAMGQEAYIESARCHLHWHRASARCLSRMSACKYILVVSDDS